MEYESKDHIHTVIHDRILKAIHDGTYPVGKRLPSESQLAKNYQVSRNSIRDALTMLEKDAIIIRRQGIGTFVAPRIIEKGKRIDQFQTLPEIIASLGYEPGLVFNDISMFGGPSYGHQTLGIEDQLELLVSKRLYSADGKPAIFVTEFIDPRPFGKIESWADFDGNMMEFLYKKHGIEIYYVFAKIRAAHGTREVIEAFGVDDCFPFLCINHMAYSIDGNPISCTQTYDHSGIFEYEFVRTPD